MKIKKLLSILMTMNHTHLAAMSHEEATHAFMASVNQTYEALQTYQKSLADKSMDLSANLIPIPDEKKNIHIEVTDEQGLPLCAQVKLYPILEGEDPHHFNVVNGRIDMILANTNEQGILDIDVPCFAVVGYAEAKLKLSAVIGWVIRISKGSEYVINEQFIPLNETEQTGLSVPFTLKRFVNLRVLGWVAGDLHHHSVYSSPLYGGTDDVVESAKEVKDAMVAMGLSFGALSDHHNTLNHPDWRETKGTHFLPIVSKEISTSNGHVMSMNVSDDVIYDIPSDEHRHFDYLLSEFVRITTLIKEQNGLAQINHPRDMNPAISLSSPMTPHIELFDTMEIWNGSIPFMSGTTNDQAFHLWLTLLKENRFIPATNGSDTHNTHANDYHHMFNELQWLMYHLEQDSHLEDENAALFHLVKQFKATSTIFEKWAEENLGTGGVRTYVYCEQALRLDTDAILASLKKGRSFLTNGPICIPKLLGKTLGENVVVHPHQDISIEIHLLSHKALETLTVESKQGIFETIVLKHLPLTEEGCLDTSIDLYLNLEHLEDEDWLVFRASSDHTHQVITNPIFVTKKRH